MIPLCSLVGEPGPQAQGCAVFTPCEVTGTGCFLCAGSKTHLPGPQSFPSSVFLGSQLWSIIRITCVSAWVLSNFTCVLLFVTLWIVAHQGFSRKEYWIGFPCPPPGDLPHLGMNPCLLCLWHCNVDSFTAEPPGKPELKSLRVKKYCSPGPTTE